MRLALARSRPGARRQSDKRWRGRCHPLSEIVDPETGECASPEIFSSGERQQVVMDIASCVPRLPPLRPVLIIRDGAVTSSNCLCIYKKCQSAPNGCAFRMVGTRLNGPTTGAYSVTMTGIRASIALTSRSWMLRWAVPTWKPTTRSGAKHARAGTKRRALALCV